MTFQKQLILDITTKLANHPNADEIYSEIVKEYPSISKATVYRNLSVLCDEGNLLRVNVPDGADSFDFNTTPHCHLKCTECNRIFDIDVNTPVIPVGFTTNNGYIINDYSILYYGLCPDCSKKHLQTDNL